MKKDYKEELIPINRIVVLKELYPRGKPKADPDVVNRYRIARKMGAVFPPIVVSKRGAGYVLIDGLHRMDAFRDDDDVIRAQVYDEMGEKAILVRSIELNSVHGNRLHYSDLVKCAVKLEKMGMSLEDIAELVKVVPSSLKRDISVKSVLTNANTGKTAYVPVVSDPKSFRTCPTCKGTGQVSKWHPGK